MKYIATCYSHFGAMRFSKIIQAEGCEAVLMPVPRSLSSSCGTCVSFVDKRRESDYSTYRDEYGEIEKIVQIGEDGTYRTVYNSEE